MVKAGILGFGGRRKSQGNMMDDVRPLPAQDPPTGSESPSSGGGFRLMSTTEAEKRKMEEKRRAQEKASSKFRPFSSFSAGNKQRNRSIDEESPDSSKRDSKSSSGTHSSTRPYANNHFGSSSTLPSSADTDSNDNIFAIPRPHMVHHGSSPSGLSNNYKKQLPAVPPTESRFGDSAGGIGRVRAMTSSSYASTAKPPTLLDGDMNFGSTSFDDLFSGLDRKEPPEKSIEPPGRSLLAGKRTFHAEPITINNKFDDVEAPLKSWDSRNSADNLMSSPRSPDNDSPPPPVPPHKYGQYAPVASESPEPLSMNGYIDNDASVVRQSVMPRKSLRESSPELEPSSITSSSNASLQTPASSRSTPDLSTPKAAVRPATSSFEEDEDDEVFPLPKEKQQEKQPAMRGGSRPPNTSTDSGRRVMTQAEFRAQQQRASAQSQEESSEEDDYEDEEDAQERAAQEAIARRKKQQMDLARETMRRTTTAPANPNRPDSIAEPFSMGFPSETSLQADEWEDEDIPLGILAQHGFPSQSQNKAPTQPANAMPSYFPQRPASAGAGDNRMSQAFRPVFARNLPDDPHASFIGGGLVRQPNRESLGFSRGPMSVAGDSMSHAPMMGYPEPQLSAPSLVEQIHMRDMTKQKYMGGASSKKPAEGPFTGMLGAQMNPPVQSGPGTRMSMMPGMQQGMGMPMMNPIGMPMMGGQMPYGMQGNDMMQMQQQQFQQMQQMIAAQQMQIQQMQMQQDPRMSMAFPSNMSDPRMSMAFPNQMPGQDPRMSMAFPNNQRPGLDPRMSTAFPNNQMQDPRMSMAFPNQQDSRMSMAAPSLLNVPGAQRPVSMMPGGSNQIPPPRPMSTPLSGAISGLTPPPALPSGYTPSIAPSERSNVGLSARYRPVQNHNDAKSSSSMTMTLQPPGSLRNAPLNNNKSKSPLTADEEDEGWGKMAARKSKYGGAETHKGESGDQSLQEIMRGLDGL